MFSILRKINPNQLIKNCGSFENYIASMMFTSISSSSSITGGTIGIRLISTRESAQNSEYNMTKNNERISQIDLIRQQKLKKSSR